MYFDWGFCVVFVMFMFFSYVVVSFYCYFFYGYLVYHGFCYCIFILFFILFLLAAQSGDASTSYRGSDVSYFVFPF